MVTRMGGDPRLRSLRAVGLRSVVLHVRLQPDPGAKARGHVQSFFGTDVVSITLLVELFSSIITWELRRALAASGWFARSKPGPNHKAKDCDEHEKRDGPAGEPPHVRMPPARIGNRPHATCSRSSVERLRFTAKAGLSHGVSDSFHSTPNNARRCWASGLASMMIVWRRKVPDCTATLSP